MGKSIVIHQTIHHARRICRPSSTHPEYGKQFWPYSYCNPDRYMEDKSNTFSSLIIRCLVGRHASIPILFIYSAATLKRPPRVLEIGLLLEHSVLKLNSTARGILSPSPRLKCKKRPVVSARPETPWQWGVGGVQTGKRSFARGPARYYPHCGLHICIWLCA